MWRPVRSAASAVLRAQRRSASSKSSPLPPGYAFGKSLLNVPQTKVSVLPNGMRVATEEGFSETATVGVFIDTGSRYETAETNGTAHFLEHLTFKGTSRRSRKQLEMEVEDIGGHLNAYTSREQTVYYAKAFKQDTAQAVDLLADIIQNSKLEPAAIEAERDVILQEMESVESSEEEVIFDRLHEAAFKDSSLGRTILGPVDNILKISRQDLTNYIDTHYTADRMVLAASGGIKHEDLVKSAEKLFGNVPAAPRNGATVVREPAVFSSTEIRIRNDDMEKAHVALAFKGASWKSADSIPLMVIQTLLGSWDQGLSGGKNMSSRLVHRIADGQYADKIATFNTHYNDTGLFGVYFVANPKSAHDAVEITLNEMVRLCFRVSEEEVERAKNQLKTQLLLNLDGTSQIAEDIGRQLLTYGRRLSVAELVARIDAVDMHTVRHVAQTYFYDQETALAATGPIYGLPDMNWIRRRTYWLRY